jgi:hypothetical protein
VAGGENEIRTYTDSDWGGCSETGRSTSGGMVLLGEHWLKSWSKTQQCVTLSSAEAELVAMSRAAAEMLGCASMARDLGDELRGQVFADSASALAVVARRGAGKLRHINITHLWLQELEKRQESPVKFSKVAGTQNPADTLTKYLARDLVNKYLAASGHEKREGRAEAGLKLSKLTRVVTDRNGVKGSLYSCTVKEECLTMTPNSMYSPIDIRRRTVAISG